MAKQTITYNPQVLNLTLYAGDGANFRLVVTNTAGVAVPLTGSMLAQIRQSRESTDPPDAVFEVDLSESVEGIADLKLTGTQTQALVEAGKYSGVWDLEWTPDAQEPITLCQGSVECLPDVSH